MKCSICGCEGHTARTCPNKNEPPDYALWVKFDGLTESEATKLHKKIIDDKKKIAPDARGTAVEAKVKELPARIKDALKLLENSDESKKK